LYLIDLNHYLKHEFESYLPFFYIIENEFIFS